MGQQNHYDVIIVGASIAGMAAAKFLAGKDLSVLVIERAKEVGYKTCAHGVTRGDLKYIDEKYFNFPLDKIWLHYKGKTISVGRKGIISSIDRTKYLHEEFLLFNKYDNLKFVTSCTVRSVNKKSIQTDKGEYFYNNLIGADGSASIVRRYLNLASKNMGMGIQYFVPRHYEKFEIFFDDKLFGSGYAWIFPNKDWTGIGCGSAESSLSPSALRANFNRWLKDNNIDFDGAKFAGAIMNCDYRGYRFGNIFLIGDAAGLIGGISGKGMYAAFASAEQVTNEILGIDKEHNHIKTYLKKKRLEETFLPLMMNGFLRKLLLRFIFTFPNFKLIRGTISKAVQ
jgi:geranylgeranyl reductase